MKKTLFSIILAALILSLSTGGFATTTDELQITSGGSTATITDGGACAGTGCTFMTGDINPLAGTDTIAGSINGWLLFIVSGTTASPGLVPFGIDQTALTASCEAVGGCTELNDLHVIYSDMNFNVPVAAGNFVTSYSETQNGTGTTSQSAYFSNSNSLFATTNLIGTIGPFSGTDHGSVSGGATAAVPSYSLTLDETFDAAGPSSFSVDGSIGVVAPEPTSLILTGTGLIGLAGVVRRKLPRVTASPPQNS